MHDPVRTVHEVVRHDASIALLTSRSDHAKVGRVKVCKYIGEITYPIRGHEGRIVVDSVPVLSAIFEKSANDAIRRGYHAVRLAPDGFQL